MRILIVEDEERLSQALVEIFKRNRYSVDAVYTGTDGLNYASSNIYDAIVLDIMLPGMDGLTVLKHLREEKNQVPVILLTAKDEIDDKVKGLDCGADDYLTKPYSTEELLARVRALTRRRGEIQDTTLTRGDLSLNKSSCMLISEKGEEIKLSLKEFQILELLFENPGQIISKERLLEKIWGGDSEAEFNNVEVYISFIRKKIKQLKTRTKIDTTRGLGYSLIEGK